MESVVEAIRDKAGRILGRDTGGETSPGEPPQEETGQAPMHPGPGNGAVEAGSTTGGEAARGPAQEDAGQAGTAAGAEPDALPESETGQRGGKPAQDEGVPRSVPGARRGGKCENINDGVTPQEGGLMGGSPSNRVAAGPLREDVFPSTTLPREDPSVHGSRLSHNREAYYQDVMNLKNRG